ncbi:MAG: isoprenylcysteine carboxylmethyltransferase family protein [Phycisphaerales bacterium]|nr:isoprenylcysteine carboxylmethyltransferase family protein [Phycisphaerales bacterium]
MTAHTATNASSSCPITGMFSGGTAEGSLPVRIAAFLYGLLAYFAFFVTIVYAICWVGNWFVPKSIDSGQPGALMPSILVNAGLLSVFVIQHTIMARPAFKRWWTKLVPATIERSTFVLLASAILLVAFWQWRPLPALVWHVEAGWARAALVGASLLGWGIVFASSFMVSHWDLFGLRQVAMPLLGRRPAPIGFRVVGLYRLVRHPLMLGFLIAFWCTPTMTVGHLLFAGLTTAYILFGTTIEEHDLVAHFGERYLDYRRRVPSLLPVPRLGRASA